jgi:hypothetical protein
VRKKLVRIGDTVALILDEAFLEEANIDGARRSSARRSKAHRKYGGVFERFAR